MNLILFLIVAALLAWIASDIIYNRPQLLIDIIVVPTMMATLLGAVLFLSGLRLLEPRQIR